MGSKKVITNDESITAAEEKLGISYPEEIREKLKAKNGFYLGGLRFYCVLDKEDLQHTFDDVVRENSNKVAGWSQYLPEGNIAIADDEGQGCLVLNTAKDGKIYYWSLGKGEIETYAENGQELINKLNAQEEEFKKL
jgi:hypothetical protein